MSISSIEDDPEPIRTPSKVTNKLFKNHKTTRMLLQFNQKVNEARHIIWNGTEQQHSKDCYHKIYN